MRSQQYTQNDATELSRKVIHALLDQELSTLKAMLDSNVVWLSTLTPLQVRGSEPVLAMLGNTLSAETVTPLAEKYTLVAHENHLWVVFGDCIAQADGVEVAIQFTLTWKQVRGQLRLIHGQTANVLPDCSTVAEAQTHVVAQLHAQPLPDTALERIKYRDCSGSLHYLFLSEVLYIKSQDKICTVFTTRGSFLIRSSIRELEHPQLMRVHRSYRVNTLFVEQLRRYCATLVDGTQIPIGKERYLDVRTRLLHPLDANEKNARESFTKHSAGRIL